MQVMSPAHWSLPCQSAQQAAPAAVPPLAARTHWEREGHQR